MTLRTGYGTGLFSAAKYGLPQVYEGAVSAVITCGTTASAQRIKIGAVSDAISSTTSVTGVRIQNGAVSDTITSSVSAAGYTTIVGAVSDTITSDVDLYWNRVRPFKVEDNVRVGVSVNARYKWLDASEPTTSWTPADYLERAA
tara:strand:- start:455 stop:886 length:432 start_codon:yes stop_codon:yes gene_type:complete